ncbi:MAG TPA: hypothetical protein VE397_14430 [Stellaceae bacterium]|nr:hypothetical protein [Stellaceae bacterium]
MLKIKDYRKLLVNEAEGAADFRWQKADQYPGDKRNERSAHALSKLAESLQALPPENPALRKCYDLDALIISKELRGVDRDWQHINEARGKALVDLFSHYGFDEPAEGDAGAFLDEVRVALEHVLGFKCYAALVVASLPSRDRGGIRREDDY